MIVGNQIDKPERGRATVGAKDYRTVTAVAPHSSGEFDQVDPHLSFKRRAIRVENADDCPLLRANRVLLAKLNIPLPLQPAANDDLALTRPHHSPAGYFHLRVHVECHGGDTANLQQLIWPV